MKKTFYLGLFLYFFSLVSFGQNLKHPRVAQLENEMTKSALQTLQGRFPNVPLMVTISIDPLRRVSDNAGSQKNKEQLPYYLLDEEEIKDEWDDPSLPLEVLMNRIRKAVVNVSVPTKVSEEELFEIKENLMKTLHLTPARDEVIVQKRGWSSNSSDQSWMNWALLLATAFFFLIGFYVVNRSLVSKFATAVAQQKPAPQDPTASMPALNSSMAQIEAPEARDITNSANIKFNDPLKLREVVISSIKNIESDPCFPTLEDMIILDLLGKHNPRSLGSILIEFSSPTQEKLFSYSFHDWWLEAFNDPGEITPDSLEVVLRMSRTHRHQSEATWQKLLIGIWRLETDRVQFIKSLERADSFVILKNLPKSVSVAIARAAYPGNWAGVIEGDSIKAEIPESRVLKIAEEAMRLKPLRDLRLLSKYKADKDLLEYLRGVDINEEREIYGVSHSDSIIHRMRPPFYPLFDLDEQDVKLVMQAVSVDEWAMAMFNILKTDRRKIEIHFSDKMRLLFVEKLKQLDSNPPHASTIGKVREKVGRIVKAIQETNAKAKLNAPEPLKIVSPDGGESAA